MTAVLPPARVAIAGNAPPSREWYQYFQAATQVNLDVGTLRHDVDALTVRVTALEDAPPSSGDVKITGAGSIYVSATAVKVVSLESDAEDPGFTTYYGTDSTGAKGWYAVSDALASSGNIAKSIDAAGVTSFDLVDLADSGTGTLQAVTFDAKGRKTGSRAATITGTAGRITVAHGDASDGLPTIDLATVLDAGGGALQKTAFDAYGRKTGTSAATTTDLAEGGNLYYTDARVRATALTGLSTATATPVTATDSVLVGVGKLQGQASAAATAIAGKEPSITAGTTAQYWRGDKTWQALDKAAVGLGNVDNTSDANKPVSTAQASALAMKQDISGLGTAAFASTGRTTGNVPVYEDFSSVGRGNPGLMLEAAAGTGRVGISGGMGETDVSGQAVFVFNAVGSASVTSSTEKRVGIFFFNVVGSTAGNRGAAFGINLKKDGAATIANAFGISNSGVVTPGADNVQTMGSAALRWSVVYAGTGTINTSDAREKTDVAPLTDAELAAAADLSRAIGTYQWLESVQLKGADARHHAGLTVQQAIAIMQAHGLDPFRYGFICFDEWSEQLEQVDEETGEVTQVYRPAGDRYSFRHDEMLLFIARGFAARLDALETAR
jgi:hypothetical protein